jgi:hypothetical protein
MMIVRWISVIAVVASIVGCGTAAQHPPPETPAQPSQLFANWPPLLNDFRFHWTSEPGIDLTTGPAVVVRAYLESYDVATFSFNLDNLYPGFLRATPENDDLNSEYVTQLGWIRPLNRVKMGPADAREHFGFVPYHFLQLMKVGDGFRAIVCSGDYADFVKSDVQPGKFVSSNVDPKTAQPYQYTESVWVHRLELTQHDPRVGPNPPAPVSAPQRGPAPAPDQDVFGNWFFTGASSSYWGRIGETETFPTPDLLRQCSDRMPQSEPERLSMMTGFKDQPPPRGNAIPGWPAKAQ